MNHHELENHVKEQCRHIAKLASEGDQIAHFSSLSDDHKKRLWEIQSEISGIVASLQKEELADEELEQHAKRAALQLLEHAKQQLDTINQGQ